MRARMHACMCAGRQVTSELAPGRPRHDVRGIDGGSTVRMHACALVMRRVHAHAHTCIHLPAHGTEGMYACMHASVYACAGMYVCRRAYIARLRACMYVCVRAYVRGGSMYVCVRACMYACVRVWLDGCGGIINNCSFRFNLSSLYIYIYNMYIDNIYILYIYIYYICSV
jgi:hypothetical protein